MELQEAPKTDPKIDKKNDQKMMRFLIDFGSILAPQIGHFGSPFSDFFGTSRQERPKRRQETPKGAPGSPKRRPRGPKRAQKGAQEAPRGPKRSQKGKRKREEIGPKRLSEHHLLKNVNFHEASVKPMKFVNFKRKGNERTRAEQETRAERENESGTRKKSGTRERE